MMTRAIVAVVAAGLALSATAPISHGQVRQAVTLPERWLPGYVEPVGGEPLIYPWAGPGQKRALLTRTTDGGMSIEWRGEAPGDGPASEIVHYVWHAGLASGYGAHSFQLHINGRSCVSFTSGRDTTDREWTRTGECGAALSFVTTRVGTFDELFGLMVLSLPRGELGAVRPLFKVVGEAAGSADYYMTFQEVPEERYRAGAEEALLKGGRRVLRVEITRIGNEVPVSVAAGGQEIWSGTVRPGYTSILLPGPLQPPPGAGEAALGSLAVSVRLDGREVASEVLALGKVRPRELHLLPHSHVDIGYSDPQPEVERKQWKNLRDAVALARETASYPPEARFRWNVEGLWPVESYLRQASAGEREAFREAVAAGSIGLQANYTNILTGICSPEELARWTDAARRMQAEYGLPPMRSAMHTDIPGLSWPVVSALAQGGVRYFSSGPNYQPGLPDLGDRIGHTLRALGDRPFWWVSPSGKDRILFWMAGRGYSWFHGLNTGPVAKAGADPFFWYARDLAYEQYEWDIAQVRYTIGGDNGPVDPDLPDFVKTWNETYDSPRLVINTADAMFAELERRHGAALPARAGDMTPYWEDGAISTAAEEATARESARRLVQAETWWSLQRPHEVPGRLFDEAWRNVLLWHEHTWGAADSISQPDRPDVVAQWEYKRQFATEAAARSKALLGAALTPARPAGTPHASSSSSPTAGAVSGEAVQLDIVNTASWARGGVVRLPAALTGQMDAVYDRQDKRLPSQRLADGRLAVQVGPVPAFAAARLTLRRGAPALPGAPVVVLPGPALQNDRIRVALDPATGDIRSLQWQGARGHDFAAVYMGAQGPGLNGYLYVPGRDPGAAQAPRSSNIVIEDAGPLVATLRVESQAPGVKSLTRRVMLAAGAETVEIENEMDKIRVRTKESAHIAFPFDVPDGTVRVDLGAALVSPERDQLPGSCRDFIGPHSAVDISNGEYGIALATLDAPLIQLGGLTDERSHENGPRRWREQTAPGDAVYAYLLNNYWHTNYKADQQGPLTFRFVLAPHGPFEAAALRRFGSDLEQPLLVKLAEPGDPVAAPFLVDGRGIVVSSVRAVDGGRARLVRLYNASAERAEARFRAAENGATLHVTRGEGTGPGSLSWPLEPFETMVVRVETREETRASGPAR